MSDMELRTLTITNLFPTVANPTACGFITSRLRELDRVGVDSVAVAVRPKRTGWLHVMMEIRGFHQKELGPCDVSALQDLHVRLSSAQYLSAWRGAMPWTGIARAADTLERTVGLTPRMPDVIAAHGMYFLPAGAVAAALAKRLGIPYVLTCHGSDVNVFMRRRASAYAEVMDGAANCIFVSSALRRKAEDLGASGKNAVVIPNGYDPGLFGQVGRHEARRMLDLPIRRPIIGFVGNMLPIKGADLLPAIFRSIAERHPDASFVAIGDGPLLRSLKRKAVDLKVRWTGRLPHEQVALHMAAMSVMIVPSRHEGWGTVIKECFASGTPVVGSHVGGIPEAISRSDWCVCPSDRFVADFAAVVSDVLESAPSPEEIRELAAGFSWRQVALRERKVLLSALEREGHE